ncbi:prolipoprotein diacylglyceryl transferase [Candidatus Omnitrophota bacterium]
MHPILVKIGPLTVYSYGLMVALGFGLAAYLAARRSRAFGISANDAIDLLICILVAGIAGARLTYVLLHLDHYRAFPMEIFLINRGGLAFYGGLVFGVLGALICIKKKRLPVWKTADLLAPFVALAHALGRIGCLLNGCCVGRQAPAGFFAAVSFPGDPLMRHPTQAYSAAALFFIFIFLWKRQDKRSFDGEVFFLYCMSYSIYRFAIEFMRDDPSVYLGLTLSQVLSLAVFSVSFSVFLAVKRRCAHSLSK